MKFRLLTVIFTCLLATGQTLAQSSSLAADSTFSILSFLETIASNHPLVRQTKLLDEAAKAEIQMARGAFDPKAEARFLRKAYDGKDYYNLLNPELKIPTLPGIDFKTGFERNTGVYVNAEDKTPAKGLRYLGVSIPLAKGLLTDSRRNGLKQAKEAQNMAAAEIQKAVNKILFSAAKDYWEWYSAYKQLENARLAIKLANTRYDAVLSRIQIGELPNIDSLEAFLFLQDRVILLNQAEQDERNSKIVISSYLWSDDGSPLDLLSEAKPAIPETWRKIPNETEITSWVDSAKNNHPEIRKFQVKTRLLELDRKLAAEMLKPALNMNLAWLSAPNPALWYDSPVNRNHKIGFDFSFPLFLRKERGKLGLMKTKILQNKLEQDNVTRSVMNDIQLSGNQIATISKNLEVQKLMVENYEKLLEAEIRKFDIGESSLFLINSRESKLIEARIKLISMETKLQKERVSLLYAAGRNPLMP